MKKEFGKHYLVELIGCRTKTLMSVKDVRRIFLAATEKSRAVVLKSFFYQFKPAGVSGVILIAESHLSIHTWPEDRYASVDIQTCGPMYPDRAVEVLKKAFEAKKVVVKIVKRGIR